MKSLPWLVRLAAPRAGFPILVIATLVLAGVARPSQGQTARSGGGNANAQLMQQLQQLATERTSLQAENARMKKELDDVRKERDSLKNSQKAFDARVKASSAAFAQSAAQRESLEQQIKQGKEKTDQLVAKFRETIQTLRQVESERTDSQQQVAERDRELKVCIDRNLALYHVNNEILTRFEHQSTWSKVAAAEPFTRIKRNQIENLVDDYKSKADDQRVTPESLKAAAKKAPPPPPPALPPPSATPPPPAPPAPPSSSARPDPAAAAQPSSTGLSPPPGSPGSVTQPASAGSSIQPAPPNSSSQSASPSPSPQSSTPNAPNTPPH